MNSGKQETSKEQTRQLFLRLLPGIIIVILQWLIRFALPAVIPGDQALIIGVFGGLLGGLAIAIWWAFFSSAQVRALGRHCIDDSFTVFGITTTSCVDSDGKYGDDVHHFLYPNNESGFCDLGCCYKSTLYETQVYIYGRDNHLFGCSSFAVEDGLLYTQEQLGDDEAVTCYNLSNGKPVWIHRYKARFWDSHAGSGPRATPTISYGRLYTFGATVILNVYDSRSGAVKWSRNAATDTGAENSGWGFTGSPLVVDYLVIVAASGELVAYNIATGKPCWFGPDGSKGYSSPHLFTIDEVPQIVLLSDTGAVSVVPSNGKILWEYPWPQVLLHRIRNRGVIV